MTTDNREPDFAHEVYSSQVLRRLHADARQLHQEYREIGRPLEHEGVKAHLHEKMMDLEDEMDRHAAMHAEHHGDLPPILHARPSRPKGRRVSRAQISTERKCLMRWRKSLDADINEDPQEREFVERQLRELDEDEARADGRLGVKSRGRRGLRRHHHRKLANAHAHLKDLAETHDFGNDARMRSYHHGQALRDVAEEMGDDGGAATAEPLQAAVEFLDRAAHEGHRGAWGDGHRREAVAHAETIKGLLSGDGRDQDDDRDDPYATDDDTEHLGRMGQKDRAAREAASSFARSNAKLDDLLGRLKGRNGNGGRR